MKDITSKILAGSAAVLIFGMVGASLGVHTLTKETVHFEVEHRERVSSTNSEGRVSQRYMIWAKKPNGSTEVFENVDSILALKFNSADLYGAMSPGASCSGVVNGFRIPFLSMNRNILEVKCDEQG